MIVAWLVIGAAMSTISYAQDAPEADTSDLTESVLGARLREEVGKVFVTQVKRGGRADRAGIRPGDQLASIEQHTIKSIPDVLKILKHVQPGHGVVMSVIPKAGPRQLYMSASGAPGASPTPSGALLGATLNDSAGTVIVGPLSMDGPAVNAGVRSGDVIVAFDGKKVTSRTQVMALLNNHDPGNRVDIVIKRGGWQRTLPVTLGSKALVSTLPKMSVPPIGQQPQQSAGTPAVNQDDPADEWADEKEAEDIYNVNERALYTDFD
jgi:S1-C subfamily serine protease